MFFLIKLNIIRNILSIILLIIVLNVAISHFSHSEPLDLIGSSKTQEGNGELINKNSVDEELNKNTKDQKSSEENDISISILKPIDPSSVGVYKEDNLGLTANMWDGSNRQILEVLVSIIPENYYSPNLRNLYKRVLLSEAQILSSSDDPLRLLELRIKKLANSGFLSLAGQLAQLVPKKGSLGRFDHLYIQEKLLDGDNLSACDRVERMFGEGRSDPLLLKYLSLCKIFAGEIDSSRLVIDLLHELDPVDSNFFSLASTLIDGEDFDLSNFDILTPLHLAMIKAAKLKIPDGILDNIDPVVLKALAESPNTSLNTRISAAERSVSLGILDSEKLSTIYSNIIFDKQRVNFIFEGEALDQVDSKALLYQIAKTQVVPEAKAEVLHKSSLIAYKEGFEITNYLVNFDSYLEIEPNNSLTWFASDAIAALLYSDRENLALNWYKLLNKSSNFLDINIQRNALNMWPIFYIIDSSISEINISEWVDKMIEVSDGRNFQQIEVTLGILQNFNLEVPEYVWLKLLSVRNKVNSYSAPSIYLINFEKAVKDNKVGEVILYSLLMLGNNEKELSPSIGLSIVKGLTKINLNDEAKKIALEILLSYYNPLIEDTVNYQGVSLNDDN